MNRILWAPLVCSVLVVRSQFVQEIATRQSCGHLSFTGFDPAETTWLFRRNPAAALRIPIPGAVPGGSVRRGARSRPNKDVYADKTTSAG